MPRTLPKKYTFAFINPGLSYATFKTWSVGMHAAAKFYGVSLEESDLNFKYDQALTQYQQLAIKNPTVVGGGTLNVPTIAAVKRDGHKVVLIDDDSAGVPNFGVNDAAVGRESVQLLTAAAKKKMAGVWKGKTVDVVGFSAPNCQPCDDRVAAAFTQAESGLGISKARTFRLVPPGQDPTTSAQTTMTDFLTAHPKDAVLVVSYGDEPVLGAVKALQAAGRKSDGIAISSGGDSLARAALRSPANAGILLGAIDFAPYAEGWNWIEVAIASALGKPFGKYSVDRVLTTANVNTFYPNDAK